MTTVAETQLNLYNDAMLICEERTLASLTEARKPRYLLDQVWNNGGINDCLEEADWIFARRSEMIVYDPSIQPSFGFPHAFGKPADWLRTSAISSDPYFDTNLTQYQDEAGYWWANLDTIYVKYVSNDVNYGQNKNLWSGAFKQFAAAHFASKIIGSLTHSKQVQDKVAAVREFTLLAARGKDTMNEPPGFFTRGQWSRARRGLYSGFIVSPAGGEGWY
jgi:hypothetical protein